MNGFSCVSTMHMIFLVQVGLATKLSGDYSQDIGSAIQEELNWCQSADSWAGLWLAKPWQHYLQGWSTKTRYALVSMVFPTQKVGWNFSFVYSAMTLGLSHIIFSWDNGLLSIRTRSGLWEYPIEPGIGNLLQFASHWQHSSFVNNLSVCAWLAAKVSITRLSNKATCCSELSGSWSPIIFEELFGVLVLSGFSVVGSISSKFQHQHFFSLL